MNPVTARHLAPVVDIRVMASLNDEFETWMRSWGATDGTVATRLSTVRTLARDGVDPLTATTDDLAAWIASHGWSGWTLSTYHASLRSLFGWLHESGRRGDNPTTALRRPRQPRSQPRPLTSDQVSALLADASPRTGAYITLGLYAGLRAHEIAKVEGQDVNRDWLYVEGKGGQRAHIPTHERVWGLAQDHPRVGYWFPSPKGGHVSGDTVTHLVGRHLRRHGIAGSAHRLRHTYATTLLRQGVNIRVVQTLMRHQSLTSTQVYTAVDDDERARAIAGLGWAA